jgi:Zn-dependent protease with chaperone function
VLDPTWQSPYVPSSAERERNARALRVDWLASLRPWLVGAAVVFVVSLLGAIAGAFTSSPVRWWWPLIALALAGAVLGVGELRFRRLEAAIPALAESVSAGFTRGGTTRDDQRLATIVDRLGATFGLHEITSRIVSDEGYNAALLPSASGLTLLVTSALMRDFELIEIEGVVAHLMARQRLGELERLAAAAVSGRAFAEAHRLAGEASAYRADEVAAAGIRYPQGLAQALAKCAAQVVPEGSYFASAAYGATRWVWFDVYADRPSPIEGDVDEAGVRARALAEW